jgi:hypothetical protein
LHKPIECKTSRYGYDDGHYTSDDEGAHGEHPSMSKNFRKLIITQLQPL